MMPAGIGRHDVARFAQRWCQGDRREHHDRYRWSPSSPQNSRQKPQAMPRDELIYTPSGGDPVAKR
jgi:hypothetical protein